MRREYGLLLAAAGAAWFLYRRQRRFDFRGASVLITGGSRGLGLELARRFAAEGARLTLAARSREELAAAWSELAATGADVETVVCDLRDLNGAERAVYQAVKTYGRLDVLVNNAGVIQVGPLEHMQEEDFAAAMAIHAWAPLHLIRAAVPWMRRQGGGRIVNITSIGGLVAIPHLLPYCMSKFAAVGLSDGLRAELARDGIRVTTVAPGLMRTGSHVQAQFKGQHEKEYGWFSVGNALPLFSINSAKAARRIVEACRYGQANLVITPQARLLHLANALFPGLVAAGQRAAARLLPGNAGSGGDQLHSGWESRAATPSFLTRPADRAIARNNEEIRTLH